MKLILLGLASFSAFGAESFTIQSSHINPWSQTPPGLKLEMEIKADQKCKDEDAKYASQRISDYEFVYGRKPVEYYLEATYECVQVFTKTIRYSPWSGAPDNSDVALDAGALRDCQNKGALRARPIGVKRSPVYFVNEGDYVCEFRKEES